MKKLLIVIPALFLLCLAPLHTALADSQPEDYDAGAPFSNDFFTIEELEDLLAPIALYPDPLIAQILPAATFIDQIDEAARYVKIFGKSAQIDRQPWDVSVKAVAHYPDVLLMMDQKYDWTVSLGQAYVNQPEDVMYAIQRLRAHAQATGNLVSTRQQQVVMEGEYIRIYPAEPEVIYVPVYDPQVVYVERASPGFGFITFGIGFTIGAWLNRDCDWPGNRVYYHGWRGGGWIDRSRPHVQIRNTVYVNNRYTVVNINKRVVNRDTVRYREQIRRDVHVRPVLPGRPLPPPRDRHKPLKNERFIGKPISPAVVQPRTVAPDRDRRKPPVIERRDEKPGQPAIVPTRPGLPTHDQRPNGPGTNRDDKTKPTVPDQSRPVRTDAHIGKPVPTTPALVTPASPPAPKPAPQDVFRGRDTQKTQPASRSGYGGYGSSTDAGRYRERGAASQDTMRGSSRPAPVPQASPPQPPKVAPQPSPAQRPAAVQRPAVPAEKPAVSKPAVQPAPRMEAPADRGDKEQRQRR